MRTRPLLPPHVLRRGRTPHRPAAHPAVPARTGRRTERNPTVQYRAGRHLTVLERLEMRGSDIRQRKILAIVQIPGNTPLVLYEILYLRENNENATVSGNCGIGLCFGLKLRNCHCTLQAREQKW